MCQHQPPCPGGQATDRTAARVLASHPEQGWSLLCNGVVLFDDAGELLLDGPAALLPAGFPGAIQGPLHVATERECWTELAVLGTVARQISSVGAVGE